MAYQAAKGNGPATGMQKTPAPDQISNPRAPGVAAYGESGGPNNPSSVPAGHRVISALGANLESSVSDDGVRDRIIREGTARQDDSVTGQLRDIAAKAPPDSFGMASARSRQPSYPGPKETIPARIGAKAAPALPNPTK